MLNTDELKWINYLDEIGKVGSKWIIICFLLVNVAYAKTCKNGSKMAKNVSKCLKMPIIQQYWTGFDIIQL